MPAPTLPHNCNSWIIIDHDTGRSVIETWSRDYADKIADSGAGEVVPAIAWLVRYALAVKIAGGEPTKAQLEQAKKELEQ